MPTIAKLVVRLSLNDSQYQKGIDNAIKQAQSAEKRIGESTKKVAAGTKKNLDGAAKTTQKLGAFFSNNSSIVRGVQNFGKQAAASFSSFGKRITSVFPAIGGLGGKLSSASAFVGKLGSAIGSGLGKAANIGKAAFGVISKGALALAGAFGIASVGATGLAGGIVLAAGKLAMAAAPIQGIKGAFEGITSTIEGGSQRMLASLQKASNGMVTNAELMRQFNTAAQLVSVDFAQKLPAAMEPIGKVAAATGQDIGYLMNSLTVGVGRLSAPILDNLAIQVDLNAAYQDFADKNGLVASSLTKAQQQMALMDQVTSKLLENTKNMPPVFGSASQVFGAFKTSLANVKDQMGMDLLPTFTQMFSIFQKFTPLLSSFGSLFTGVFAGVFNVVKGFGKGIAKSLGIDMDSLGGNMGSWGSNIVTQLAHGMAKAIGAVISVLTQLGAAIADWLSPGSPPKLLPDLPDWGESAGNWFLKGMSNANVGVLRDLSGQVESFIRSNMAGKSSEAIAQKVLASRGKLEGALSTGGNLMDAVPKAVRGYAAALMESSQAAERLKKAQDNLNKVTKDYDDKLKPISDRLAAIQAERDKFEQGKRVVELQAIVADPTADKDAVRFAQLELEEIALQNQEAAIEANKETAVNAAQEKVDAAQSEMDIAEQRLQLEQELLQHQIETNNLMADTIAKTGEMGGAMGGAAGAIGGAAGALENMEEAMGGVGGVAPALDSTMSALTESIMGEFDGIAVQAEALGETWGRVADGLILKWQGVVDWWSTNFGEGGVWSGIMDMASQIFEEQWGEGGTWAGIMENIKTVIGLLKDKWNEKLEEIKTITSSFTDKIEAFFERLEKQFWGAHNALDTFFQKLKNAAEWVESKMPQWPNFPGGGGSGAGGDGFATGTGGRFQAVPANFHNDTFPVFMQSGEDFMVRTPADRAAGVGESQQPTFINNGAINNGMDLMTLEAQVRRWVRTEIKR